MDPLSHYMIAYVFGRKINVSTIKLKALTLGALLPDIDVISVVLGIDFLRDFHGTITHSITGAVFLSVIASLMFLLFRKEMVFVYTLIGVSMHLLLDTVNTLTQTAYASGGLMLLYPFSEEKFGLAHVVPNPMVIWFIVAGTILAVSAYLLYRSVRQEDYPWRIWIDERNAVITLKKLGRKR